MNAKIEPKPEQRPAFGTVLADHMAIASYANGSWGRHELRATGTIPMHPSAHVLHYASTCFEGFKAYRGPRGTINVFRMDRHIERMRQSARLLSLPEPDPAQLVEMIRMVIDRCRASVPEAPGALYMRPMLLGTMPNIGAAATPSNEAVLIVLASPVWDYFTGGMKPLRMARATKPIQQPHATIVSSLFQHDALAMPMNLGRHVMT